MQPKVPPPIVMLLAALIMWALHRWLPLGHWISSPWDRLGALVAAAGIALVAPAMAGFRRARTTVNPMDPGKASQLVTDGIYRVTRNPMYLGLTLLLAGWGLWLGSASPWLIPPLFVLVITCVQIIPEERALEQLFGDAYRAYRRRVPRWIGRP
jgi:protein-S-isoprenylcysteine O-methyltransferase Ste14